MGGDEREVARQGHGPGDVSADSGAAGAEPFAERTWSIESADGLGSLLAQQLVDAGEVVLAIPPTLVSSVRVLSTGRSEKNDPNDAFSVAIAALRSRDLRTVEQADHSEIMRVLAKRNHDLGRLWAKLIRRLHHALADLSPGGIAKELCVSDANRLLGTFESATPIEHMCHRLALELVDDMARLDEQIKTSVRKPGRTARRAARRSGPSDQGPRLCRTDYEIVKVSAHLESARLFDPADPHRLKARRSDQVLDFGAPVLVLGHVEQNRGLGRPVARGLEEIGRHGAEGNGKACPDRQPPSDNLAR
jgi:hypothetical protein